MRSRGGFVLACLLWSGAAAAVEPEPATAATATHSSGPTADVAGASLALDKGVKDGLRKVGRGIASWYGAAFQGKRTASGEAFNMHDFTAAHPSLPFGTRVEVRSLVNGRTVTVRINDRGPFTGKRVIDLSRAAAQKLGLVGRGTKPVEMRIADAAGDEPLQAADGN